MAAGVLPPALLALLREPLAREEGTDGPTGAPALCNALVSRLRAANVEGVLNANLASVWLVGDGLAGAAAKVPGAAHLCECCMSEEPLPGVWRLLDGVQEGARGVGLAVPAVEVALREGGTVVVDGGGAIAEAQRRLPTVCVYAALSAASLIPGLPPRRAVTTDSTFSMGAAG
jgi:hypothetical protein